MSIERDLLAEWDRDVAAGARAVFDDFRDRARTAPATPRDTGRLADGIDFPDGVRGRPASAQVIYADMVSTAVTDRGADYGTILDRSTGRLVEAADYGHTAFGPIRPPVGGRSFLRRFRVTTEHVGWWDAVTTEAIWAQSVRVLDRFNL